MKNYLLFVLVCIAFTSCGPKIYKSTEFDDVATKHKLVAILPADVTISLRPNQSKKLTPGDLEKNREETAYAIQEKMYSWFIRRS